MFADLTTLSLATNPDAATLQTGMLSGPMPVAAPVATGSSPAPAFPTLLQGLLLQRPISGAGVVGVESVLANEPIGPPSIGQDDPADGITSPEQSGNELPALVDTLGLSGLRGIAASLQAAGDTGQANPVTPPHEQARTPRYLPDSEQILDALSQLLATRAGPRGQLPSRQPGFIPLPQPHIGPVVPTAGLATAPGELLAVSSQQGTTPQSDFKLTSGVRISLSSLSGKVALAADLVQPGASPGSQSVATEAGLTGVLRAAPGAEPKDPSGAGANVLQLPRHVQQDMVMPGARAQPGAAQNPLSETMERQIKVLVARHGGSADIRLNPPQLGHLRISVIHADGNTRVSVVAHTDVASQLLHEQLPQLRALLGDAVTVTVHQHGGNSFAGAGGQNPNGDASTPGRLDSGGFGVDDRGDDYKFTDSSSGAISLHAANGLIDLYA